MATFHGLYSVRLQDYLGIRGTQVEYMRIDDAKTLAQIVTACADINLLLDPLTDAKGVSCRLEIEMPLTNLKSSISVNNRLDSGGLFTFQQATINRAFSIFIPAFAEAKISGGKVNLGDTDVTNWIGEQTLSSSAFPKESNVQNLLPTFSSCRLNDRKHRKSETRLTSEPGS